MADKYNNDFACMTVYYQIVWMYDVPIIEESESGIYHLDSLNSDARKIAVRYLIKADSLRNKEVKDDLEYRKVESRRHRKKMFPISGKNHHEHVYFIRINYFL